MKCFIGVLLLFGCFFMGFAQDTLIYKIDGVHSEIKSKNGKITRKVIYFPSEKQWWVEDKKADFLIHSGYYADAVLKIKEGEHEYFYDNGYRKLEINYIKGKKEGVAFKYKEFVFLPPDSVFFYQNNKPVLARKIKNHDDYVAVMENLKIPGFESSVSMPSDDPPPPPPLQVVEEAPVPDEDKIYTRVEIEPQFKTSFRQFLKENLKYPQKAKRKKQEGIVRIAFIIEKNGEINSLQVEKENSTTQNEQLLEEALRLVQLSSGKWNPSIQNGVQVKAYYSVSIAFFLDGSLEKSWPR